jgi:hypothetical protein
VNIVPSGDKRTTNRPRYGMANLQKYVLNIVQRWKTCIVITFCEIIHPKLSCFWQLNEEDEADKHTVTDYGICSLSWQWFALGKADRLLFVTTNRCTPVTNKLGWNAVVFCACEMLDLFSLGFCVVRAVHKFDFSLVMKETPNKWRPSFVKKSTLYSDTDSYFWQDVPPPPLHPDHCQDY